MDNTERRVDSAGVVEAMASWHRARRMSVLGEGEADWRAAACWQSSKAGLNFLMDM